MKIGIVYDDICREGLDCSRPYEGNPGVGGTQYCFLMLMYFYVKYFPSDSIVVYRHKNLESLPHMPHEDIIQYSQVSNVSECVEKAAQDCVDCLLFSHGHLLDIVDALEKYHVKGVVWVHNWIRDDYLRIIDASEMIVRVVFLGREHYDRYIDHEIIKKAVVIPNMFSTENYPRRKSVCNHSVTYVGAIVPGKGFHALAEAWPQVIQKVPDANLYVIGKGNLYGKNIEPGPLGIADVTYESKFCKYITDDKGEILPSVHFLGILGAEKVDYYINTSVGVVNPTGVTEVCPISALEMEAASIPVVSKRFNGLPDVVVDGKTGVLIRKPRQLSKAIVDLLLNMEKNLSFGYNGREYVHDVFSPERIVELWNDMFTGILKMEKPSIQKPKTNFKNNFKWIRILNAKIKKIPLLKNLPAIIDLESKIRKILRG